MMAVARYWESISNETKTLFSVIAKKMKSTFSLEKGINFKTNDSANKKNVFLLEK